MFDFEKLEVYQHLRELNADVFRFLAATPNLEDHLRSQFRRATLSAALNLAEGSGRMTKPDKKRFYTIARSSVFECVAIMHVIQDQGQMDEAIFNDFYTRYTTASKMLLGMYRSMITS